jgi:phosphoglycerol transferase MdoB-like AlkP superfamily enzyme
VLARLKTILFYFLYWLIFFEIGRVLFFIINHDQSTVFKTAVLLQSMVHGLWLDASVAGYFTLLYCLVHLVSLFLTKWIEKTFKIIHYFLLAISCLALISNAVLYTYWSVPLDVNAIKYLKDPGEAAASINWLHMILPVLAGLVLFVLFKFLYNKLQLGHFAKPVFSKPKQVAYAGMLMVLAAICIVPIRGGLGIVPVNLSFVFFHKDIFPNHAAYNPVWNVLYSWAESSKQNSYSFMEEQLADEKFSSLYKNQGKDSIRNQWLNASKPNVIVVVLESYLSKLVNLKYEGQEVTPYFNQLSREGIYFSNLYASGDRSDKGLISMFSGFPAMPKSSIAQFPEKFSKLPSLFKDFSNAGYSTAFYYGGNLDFANLRSYFISAGAQNITTGDMVKGKPGKGKWGVHDEFMFNELLNGLKGVKKPFFSSLFTLSNHEPFDIPGKFYFGKRNGDEEYMSSAYYTDQCLKKFMEDFRKTNLWQNTLVVLVADHGVNRLGIKEMFDPEKFHIPMIWTGGAVKKSELVDKICSQTDVPTLILSQCNVKAQLPYPYSKAIDQPNSNSFATYFCNDGIGFVNKNCTAIFDNVTLKYHFKFCQNDSVGSYGKAYLQVLSREFR